jgi:hypothetical protein
MLSCHQIDDIVKMKRNKMKKVLLSVLAATLMLTVTSPAQAQDQKVLAIIDSAINSNNFPAIIHEVCFTAKSVLNQNHEASCPNMQHFMEGKGAASATWPKSINDPTYHGDSMVKAALATDPNLKIVFVRFNNVNRVTGSNALGGTPEALISAIDWVSKNAEKYSIDALSISQSGVSMDLKTGTKILHPACTNTAVASSVSQLSEKNIPSFAATGNDGLSNLVGFPACVPGVIGVGAMGSPTQFEKATNRGPGLDMVAFGKVKITKYNGSVTDIAGSSGATVVTSASYVSKNTGKAFTEYINSLVKVVLSGVSYPYSSK